MEKAFNPAEIEGRLYQQWEQQGYFKPQGEGEAYSIMIPPPNVTGTLHMGHGFQEAIMDALIRFHRMDGYNTLWQVGTDHAGIATQMVVERQLEAEGKTRHDLGREAFIEKVWEWKHHSGGAITQQLRRLGASLDWSRERFTMDPDLSEAVQMVFIHLYHEGLIYRGKRLVNWDPALHTAISDLEVLSEEEKGFLWHFRYPIADSDDYVVVATTRPETMLGDTAVAVHPEDERYAHMVGKEIELPLTGRRIPIVADDYVDQEFGSGCVKITPAHDFNDYEVGQRHHLAMINVFDDNAALNNNAPEAYRGMDRFAARKKIIADLEALGLLEKTEDHTLKVPRGDRSGVVIEPYLTDQWYVDAKTLAGPAIAAVENGDIQFVPKQWENTYYAWMRDIQDWCISRQLWWGHRIPAWYDDAGNVFVGKDEASVRADNNLDDTVKLRQDEDVLDTWFSSALWTFSTLGWPRDSEDLATFHPSSVLVTGFDIIFFWVARMIMMTLHLRKEVPFHTIYVHGLVRDNEGQKMSKSKGNVLDPIDLIDGIDLESLVSKRTQGMMQPKLAAKVEKATRKQFPDGLAAYGTDALRFTFYSLASTGRDINFDVGRIEGFRNFCNKIWNAARYVMMNLSEADFNIDNIDAESELAHSQIDQWIISRLHQTTAEVRRAIANYRFDHASQALYEFMWHDYCDWYVELSKPVLWDENAPAAAKTAVLHTLFSVLEQFLRLLHPFMPFISEEIWLRLTENSAQFGDTLMLAKYPDSDETRINQQAMADTAWLKDVISSVRNIRGEMNIPPSKTLAVLLRAGDANDRSRVEASQALLKKLAKLDSIEWLDDNAEIPPSASALVGDLEVLVPMAGFIDRDAEMARLEKEATKIAQELKRLEGKLSNPAFVDKAPEAVVAKEREKLASGQQAQNKLQEQIARIAEL